MAQPNVPLADDALRHVLVVDDLPDWSPFFRGVARRIHHLDVRVTMETSAMRALELLRTRAFDVVVSDFRLRDGDGIDLLTAARYAEPSPYRVLMTSYAEIPLPVSVIRRAQIDAYLLKPLTQSDTLLALLPFLDRAEGAIAASRAEAREMERVAEDEEAHRAPRHAHESR